MGLTTSKQVKLTKGLQDDGFVMTEWTPTNQITLKKGNVTITLFPKK